MIKSRVIAYMTPRLEKSSFQDIRIQESNTVHTYSLMEFESLVQFLGGFANLPTTPTQLLRTSMCNPSSSSKFAAPIITSLVPSSPLPTSMSNPSSSPRSITLHHDLDGTFITIT